MAEGFRADLDIYRDVADRLEADGQIDTGRLILRVHLREVTLLGTVRSAEEKARAELVTRAVEGVLTVNNQLRAAEEPQAA